jgi:hypothetical protein
MSVLIVIKIYEDNSYSPANGSFEIGQQTLTVCNL